VFQAPVELGVVVMAAEAHRPGLFIGRQWRFAVARSFLRRPIFFRHMRAALARVRLRTMLWLPPCSLVAPARSVPREVSSMALVGSSSRLSDCVDVLCCTRAWEGRGQGVDGIARCRGQRDACARVSLSPGMGHGQVNTGMGRQCTLEETELTARTRMEVSEKGKERAAATPCRAGPHVNEKGGGGKWAMPIRQDARDVSPR
jgi:hypothetical protein